MMIGRALFSILIPYAGAASAAGAADSLLIPYAGAASAAGAADSLPPPRQAFSNSWKVGRTCPGMARRATSTAMMGAVPFSTEKIKTRKTMEESVLFIGGFRHV